MTDVDHPNGRLRPRRKASSNNQPTRSLRKLESHSEETKPKDSGTEPDTVTQKSDSSNSNDKTSTVSSILCLFCDRTFHSKKAITKHVQRIHNAAADKEYPIKCTFCNHTETDTNDFIKHMLEIHPTQYFACGTCTLRFNSLQELNDHFVETCHEQNQINQPYRSKLRHKNNSQTPITTSKIESSKFDVTINEPLTPNVKGASSEDNIQKDYVDFEESISMNLILPSSKNICTSNLNQKRAVIVLDDIQWKRKPTNISNAIQRADHTDQILSRLGVVHRSRGTETSRYWYRHIEENSKFERCFDTTFYVKVANNVRENLQKFLDGASNVKQLKDGEPIKTRKSKNNVVINTIEGFPTLLALGQFSRNTIDDVPRAIAPKQKWKWDNTENDKQTATNDDLGIIKLDPHKNKCIISMFSSLDIWTQLCMREKYEKIWTGNKTIQNPNTSTNELKHILESRELPNTSTEIVKYTCRQPSTTESLEFPLSLGLVPSAPECEIKPAVLSGEWARKRCYVCSACGEQLQDPKSLFSHHSINHPQAQVSHYEIVGEDLLNADILKHLYVPPTLPSIRTSRRSRGSRHCTKCGRLLMIEDLHDHMLECAGDIPAPRRKVRCRPFGVRRRRTRLQEKNIRKQLRNNRRNRRTRQNELMRSRSNLRSEVGDAETIKRMIADLPAKRHRVTANPIINNQRTVKRRDYRIQIHRVRPNLEPDSSKSPSKISKNKNLRSVVTRSKISPRDTIVKKKMSKGPQRPQNSPSKGMKVKIIRKNILRRSQRKLQEHHQKPTVVSSENAAVTELTSTEVSESGEALNLSSNAPELSESNISSIARSSSGGNSSSDSRRGKSSNDGNSQSGRNNSQNPNGPKKSVPLKHSIESLTSTVHVDTYRKHSFSSMHQKLPLESEPNSYEQYDERRMLVQEQTFAKKLDKPPLCSKTDEYTKSKANRSRKGLNDCIAMLKGKLFESPCRSPIEHSIETPVSNQPANNTRCQPVATNRDSFHCYENSMAYHQSNPIDYDNASMIPLDLSGKSYPSMPPQPVKVSPVIPISSVCLAPIQSEPLPLVTTQAKPKQKSATLTMTNPASTAIIGSTLKTSPVQSIPSQSGHVNQLSINFAQKPSPSLIKVSVSHPVTVQSGKDSITHSIDQIVVQKSPSILSLQAPPLPKMSSCGQTMIQTELSGLSKISPTIPPNMITSKSAQTLSETTITNVPQSARSMSVPPTISSQSSKKCVDSRRSSEKMSPKTQLTRTCEKNSQQRPIYDPTLKIPKYKVRQTQEADHKDQSSSKIPPDAIKPNDAVALLPKEILEILGTMSIQDRNKLLNALPQVFAKTVKDLKLVVDSNINNDSLISPNKSEIATQTNSTPEKECSKELINIDTEKYLIDPVSGIIIERQARETSTSSSPQIPPVVKESPRVDVIDLTAEEEENEKKIASKDSNVFLSPQIPEKQDAEQRKISNIPGITNTIQSLITISSPLVKSKGSSEKTASLRAVRIKSANEKLKNLNYNENLPPVFPKPLETAEPDNLLLKTTNLSETRLTLETAETELNATMSMTSPAIQQAEISSTQQSSINFAKLNPTAVNTKQGTITPNDQLTSKPANISATEKEAQKHDIGFKSTTEDIVNKIENTVDSKTDKIQETNVAHDSFNAQTKEKTCIENKRLHEIDKVDKSNKSEASISIIEENQSSKIIKNDTLSNKNAFVDSLDEDDPEDDVSLALIVKQKLIEETKIKSQKKKNTAKRSRKQTKSANIPLENYEKVNEDSTLLVKSSNSSAFSNTQTINVENLTELEHFSVKKGRKVAQFNNQDDINIDNSNDKNNEIIQEVANALTLSPLPLRRSRRIKSVFVESTPATIINPNLIDTPVSIIVQNKLPWTKKQLIFSKLLDEKKSQDLKLKELENAKSVSVVDLQKFRGELILECDNTQKSSSILEDTHILQDTITESDKNTKNYNQLDSTAKESINHNIYLSAIPEIKVNSDEETAKNVVNVISETLNNQKLDQEIPKDKENITNAYSYSDRFTDINDIAANLAVVTPINSKSEVIPVTCEAEIGDSELQALPEDRNDTVTPVESKKRKAKIKKGKKKHKISEQITRIKADSPILSSTEIDDLEQLVQFGSNEKSVNPEQIKDLISMHTSDIEKQRSPPVKKKKSSSTSKLGRTKIKSKKSAIIIQIKGIDDVSSFTKHIDSEIKSPGAIDPNSNDSMINDLTTKNDSVANNKIENLSNQENINNDDSIIIQSDKDLNLKENTAALVDSCKIHAVKSDENYNQNDNIFHETQILQKEDLKTDRLIDSDNSDITLSSKKKKIISLKRKREPETNNDLDEADNSQIELSATSGNSLDSNQYPFKDDLASEFNFATRRTRSKSMLFKTVTATSPQDFDILGPVCDEFSINSINSTNELHGAVEKVHSNNLPDSPTLNKHAKNISKNSIKKENNKKRKDFLRKKVDKILILTEEKNPELQQQEAKSDLNAKTDSKLVPTPTISPTIADGFSDSDDSSKSDVPLNQYVKVITTKNEKEVRSDKVKGKAGPKSFIKNRRKTIASCEISKAKHTNKTDDQTKSDQFMESFGFFSERKPRKSNLLAAKKIFETFHDKNDSDEVSSRNNFKTKQNQSKENNRSKVNSKRSTSKVRSNKTAPSKKTSKVSKAKSRPGKSYCDICKKQFRRPDNLTRHFLTLFHVSNLSAIEQNLEPNTKDEPPNCLVVYRRHLDNLKRLQLEGKTALKDLPTLSDILRMTLADKCGPKVSGRDLSRDEALFFECCELLKDSYKTESAGAQSSTNNEPAPEPTNPVINMSLESLGMDIPSVPDANFETTMPTEVAVISTKSPERDEDVDSITAKEIMESEEVRNLENDLISGLTGGKAMITFNEESMSSVPGAAPVSGPYDFTSDEDTNMDMTLSKFHSEKSNAAKNKEKAYANNLDNANDIILHRNVERLQSLPSTSTGIYHTADLFEDKFDKIKRKCRSQAAAAKNSHLSLETSNSEKPKKKIEKKSSQKRAKKQQCTVPTKGALKGFDGIKLSTESSDLKQVNTLPNISEIPKKKKKKARSKKSFHTSNSPIILPKTSLNIVPKNKVDVYEFMDDIDDNDTIEFRPTTLSERIRNALKTQSASHGIRLADRKDTEDSAESASDDNDFVYMSDDYLCSANETETENSLLSDLGSSIKSLDSKKNSFQRKDTTEKNTVMGKIFKSNALRNERRTNSRENIQEVGNRTDLDQLFDSLLEKDSLKEKKVESVRQSPIPTPEIATPEIPTTPFEDFLLSDQEAGVARQRARRKCTVGKQNILAETWSSESEPETSYRKPHGTDSTSSSRKKKLKKAHIASGKDMRKIRHITFKDDEERRVISSGSVSEDAWEREGDAEMYYSSEEDSRALVEQHGWIVGDSHKKLVTMLAHAKGRKRDEKRQFIE